jgi:hypothetical protein
VIVSEGENDGAIIEPVEQRVVAFMQAGHDEVLAARTPESEIYLPLRPLCTALGLGWSPQLRKIRADEILVESTRQLRIQTRGGAQVMLCMDLEAVPLWLAGIEPSRVREDLRERLKAYKRWVRKVVYEAFARETGLDTARTTSPPPSPSSEIMALEQIERMGLAIATMARQQIAYERQTDMRLATLEAGIIERHEAITGRLDQAAAVVGSLLRRMNAVEGLISSGETISNAQAAEISALVKAIAAELTETDRKAGRMGRNHYQAIFAELYRRFRVPSYHNVPLARFNEVIQWLRDYQETLDAHGDGSII